MMGMWVMIALPNEKAAEIFDSIPVVHSDVFEPSTQNVVFIEKKWLTINDFGSLDIHGATNAQKT